MSTDRKDIHIIQADIIYKALHYVCKHEDIPVNDELERVFKVLSEDNPCNTGASDCLDVMAGLANFIKSHDMYAEYFEGNEDDEN